MTLKKRYIADLVCFEQIIVEIKALLHLSGNEKAQLLNYLKGTGFPVGVLINFGSHGKLEWKRLVKVIPTLQGISVLPLANRGKPLSILHHRLRVPSWIVDNSFLFSTSSLFP